MEHPLLSSARFWLVFGLSGAGFNPCVWGQSLSHCELITDDGIRHLGNGACAHDRLEVIELDNCPLITDASLEHLKSCHSLERIELYDCQQITRAGIKRLRVSREQGGAGIGRVYPQGGGAGRVPISWCSFSKEL